ncbi:hypothetical protein ABZ883_07780 [Streptomyces sp. NPDC046977]|uniref:hypothetical protein n=1 Tax=Streptomyces sp. NPDC046977 TaxID=3154703 RepID=UPI0033F282A5
MNDQRLPAGSRKQVKGLAGIEAAAAEPRGTYPAAAAKRLPRGAARGRGRTSERVGEAADQPNAIS